MSRMAQDGSFDPNGDACQCADCRGDPHAEMHELLDALRRDAYFQPDGVDEALRDTADYPAAVVAQHPHGAVGIELCLWRYGPKLVLTTAQAYDLRYDLGRAIKAALKRHFEKLSSASVGCSSSAAALRAEERGAVAEGASQSSRIPFVFDQHPLHRNRAAVDRSGRSLSLSKGG